jgi:putative membrane protein
MKLILRTLIDDIKGIVTNFFAFVVIGGLCLIPCLYAWFNIYSNWDPYGSTGNVKIAVMSEDKGYTDEDGKYYNMGESVVDNLRTNTKLGWVFVDSRQQAEDGVESGKYYAAIVVGENFSESMFDFIEDGLVTPSITYYENSKKNAIAAKITQSGKSTLEETINEEFVNTVVTTVVSGADGMFGGDEDILVSIVDDLNTLSEDLASYDETINSFIESNEAMMSTLNYTARAIDEAGDEFSSDNIESMKAATSSDIDDSISRVSDTLSYIKGDNAQIIDSMNQVQEILNTPNTSNEDVSAQLQSASAALDDLIAQNAELSSLLMSMAENVSNLDTSSDTTSAVSDMAGALYGIAASVNSANSTLAIMSKAMISQLDNLNSNSAIASAVVRTTLAGMAGQTASALERMAEVYDNQIDPALTQVGSLMASSVNSVYDTVGAAASNVSYFSQVIDGLTQCISGMNEALTQVSEISSGLGDKISTLTQTLSDVAEGDTYDTFKKIMSNDAETFGEFFSSPVQVTTVAVYETANYGSSVTPFYTVLAIWVGGILLAALVKTVPDGREYLKGAKDWQLYFSRLALYLLLGQIQAIITALGDIYLLKVQCLHPAKFVLISCFTSLTFVTLIYTLTLSFGDVGKALVVVLVVIQIAGSGGTYPIEILPKFFSNVYKYLPFPYPIDAMRECISGMYGNDYWLNYIGLVIYLVASLLLGLFARKPFMSLTHFIHRRMKDTELM